MLVMCMYVRSRVVGTVVWSGPHMRVRFSRRAIHPEAHPSHNHALSRKSSFQRRCVSMVGATGRPPSLDLRAILPFEVGLDLSVLTIGVAMLPSDD